MHTVKSHAKQIALQLTAHVDAMCSYIQLSEDMNVIAEFQTFDQLIERRYLLPT